MKLKDLSNVDLKALYEMAEIRSEQLGRIIKMNAYRPNSFEYINSNNAYNAINVKKTIILTEIINRIMSVENEEVMENN